MIRSSDVACNVATCCQSICMRCNYVGLMRSPDVDDGHHLKSGTMSAAVAPVRCRRAGDAPHKSAGVTVAAGAVACCPTTKTWFQRR